MENLIKNLTQKNEELALKSAKEIIDNANIEAFEKLCEKTDFLFDFIKTNVCKRLYNAANKDNFKNILKFFQIYDATYCDVFAQILAKYKTDELNAQIFEILKNGDENEKAYCAKYFEYIEYPSATEELKASAFSDFTPLSENAIKTLAKIKNTDCIEIAYQKLDSNDSFEILKGIKFLATYPELSQINKIISAAINCSMPENAASEIANATDLYNLAITNQNENNLLLLNAIINGLGEILPLYQIIDFKIFDITKALINQNYEEENSQIAQILLNLYSKISLLFENEEYTYDEDIETKNELKRIIALLKNQGESFLQEQKQLIFDELKQSDKRISAALQVIKEMKIDNDIEKIVTLTNHSNELIICIAVETLATLGKLSQIDINQISQNITNQNILAIIQNFALINKG